MPKYGLIHPDSGNRYLFSTVVMDVIDGPMSNHWYSTNYQDTYGPALTLDQAHDLGYAGPKDWYPPGEWPVYSISIADLLKHAEPANLPN
jgi:hypothetical protein